MKKIHVAHKLITLALAVLLLAGCGSGSPAPSGSTIVFSPTKIDYIGGDGTAAAATPGGCGGEWSYDTVTITVIGSNGRAVQYVDVAYTLSWTTETSVYDTQRLYLGPPTGDNPPPFRLDGTGTIQTDISGRIELIVATDIECPHLTSLNAQSGSASGVMAISVEEAAVPVP